MSDRKGRLVARVERVDGEDRLLLSAVGCECSISSNCRNWLIQGLEDGHAVQLELLINSLSGA